jgi:cytochrome bd-type quinol oxidase subunit 2
MTMGDLWPLLRQPCRVLALLGWLLTAAGMGAGLAIALTSGTTLSPAMISLQQVSALSMGLALASLGAATLLQPRNGRDPGNDGVDSAPEPPEEFPETVRSLLVGALALLAGAVAFAASGLVLRSGHGPQSLAFCQVFLLGAASSGFSFLLFSKVARRQDRR